MVSRKSTRHSSCRETSLSLKKTCKCLVTRFSFRENFCLMRLRSRGRSRRFQNSHLRRLSNDCSTMYMINEICCVKAPESCRRRRLTECTSLDLLRGQDTALSRVRFSGQCYSLSQTTFLSIGRGLKYGIFFLILKELLKTNISYNNTVFIYYY